MMQRWSRVAVAFALAASAVLSSVPVEAQGAGLPPTPVSALPPVGAQGAEVTVSIRGWDLAAVASVSAGDGVTAVLRSTAPTVVTATFRIDADAVPGPRVVSVSDNSGRTGTCHGCFDVRHGVGTEPAAKVQTWGWNSFGQLGWGDNEPRLLPDQMAGATGIVAAASMASGTLLLRDDGRVLWTGDPWIAGGPFQYAHQPHLVAGITDAVEIACYAANCYVLKDDGTILAWGDNSFGQLGDGSNDPAAAPVQVSGITTAATIAAGDGFALAALQDGSVVGWGSNWAGELGRDDVSETNVPLPVAGLDGVADLAAGWSHGLALLGDGTVMSWGDNSAGQLGDGTFDARFTPLPVADVPPTVSIAAAPYGSLAVASDGSLRVWGDVPIGDGLGIPHESPTLVEAIPPVTSVSAQYAAVFAIADDGSLVRWSSEHEDANWGGQLATGDMEPSTTPGTVSGLADVRQVVATWYQTVAVLEDGTVWAWGPNLMGGLGHGGVVRSSEPGDVELPSEPVQVAAGWWHSVALLADGTVWTWGAGQYGQLGTGDFLHRETPMEVEDVRGAVFVAAGPVTTYAIMPGGQVMAWGDNQFGQLGDGTMDASAVPVVVEGVSDAVRLGIGVSHALAVQVDGSIMAWGTNSAGELDGTPGPDEPLAITVPAGPFVAVAAGWGHTLALAPDGTVYSWGHNDAGQLGLGHQDPTSGIQIVPGVAEVVQLGANFPGFSLALDAHGDVWGWGYAGDGELGIPGTFSVASPTLIAAGGTAGIAAGDGYSLLRDTDGALQGSGSNQNRQLRVGGTQMWPTFVAAFGDIGVADEVLGVGAGGQHVVSIVKQVPIVACPTFDKDIVELAAAPGVATDAWDALAGTIVPGDQGYELRIVASPVGLDLEFTPATQTFHATTPGPGIHAVVISLDPVDDACPSDSLQVHFDGGASADCAQIMTPFPAHYPIVVGTTSSVPVDVDEDLVATAMLTGPAGPALLPGPLRVAWQPTMADVGHKEGFVITITSNAPGCPALEIPFSISVAPPPSPPPGWSEDVPCPYLAEPVDAVEAIAGARLEVEFRLINEAGIPYKFDLQSPLPGMEVSERTGWFSWRAAATDVGEHEGVAILVVTTAPSCDITHPLEVTVIDVPPTCPTLSGVPTTVALPNGRATLAWSVVDPDGQGSSIKLDLPTGWTGTARMAGKTAGLEAWTAAVTAPAGAAGQYSAKLRFDAPGSCTDRDASIALDVPEPAQVPDREPTSPVATQAPPVIPEGKDDGAAGEAGDVDAVPVPKSQTQQGSGVPWLALGIAGALVAALAVGGVLVWRRLR